MNWREEIDQALKASGDTWNDVVEHTLSRAELDEEFDGDYGAVNGRPFTLWTKTRVYFPHAYDGFESVAWVARNPNGRATRHIGGWE